MISRIQYLLLLAVAATSGVAVAGTRQQEPAVPLVLQAATFDPLERPVADALSHVPRSLLAAPRHDELVLIQFDGPPRAEWLAELRRRGVTVFDYVPRNAHLAELPETLRRSIETKTFVRAIVPYVPALRVAPRLWAAAGEDSDPALILRVQARPDLHPAELSAAARRVAPQAAPGSAGRHPGSTMLDVRLDRVRLSRVLPRLAALSGVIWIDERLPVSPRNNEMKSILQTGTGSDTRLFGLGLTGAGQVLGIADSGLDVDHCFFQDGAESVAYEQVDPDSPPVVPLTNPYHRKVLAYQYHSGSDATDGHGHGTHVVGTAVADDLANPAAGADPGLDPYDGMAPAASVVFQDIHGGGVFLDVPTNLYGFLQAAYSAGARIHSNSWGSSTSAYDSDASQMDRFSWDNPDMLFVVAAGNDGPAAGTVGAPATAKNVVSVGMVATPASGDPDDLDAQSSNGPTADGRRKPEIVNVGGYPIRSALAGSSCGITEMGGTSMATPGVAGGAALIRQYLIDGYHPHGYATSGPSVVPSAALLKALIVNGAVNIDGANVDGPIPDNSQGWGRVLLDDALSFPGDLRSLQILNDDDLGSPDDGFAVGATVPDDYGFFRCRDDLPLKVTLVWTDAPVSPTSGQAWVNDLDLEVVTPGGTLYRGNAFSGGVSTSGGTADDRNNVEQVLLPAGVGGGGDFVVHVVPRHVGVGPQPYALVATGAVSQAPVPRLVVTGTTRAGGCDADPYLDDFETIDVVYTITNEGCGASDTVEATLTGGAAVPATISPTTTSLAGLAPAESVDTTFQVTLEDEPGACGGRLPLTLRLQDPIGGARWEHADTQLLRLDPVTGARSELDDVESGDRSVERSPEWDINACAVSSGSSAWHLGDPDCAGIPKDGTSHALVFEYALAEGESLSSVSFVHAFDGYANSSFTDSAHLEIDHDLDGNWSPIASWNEGEVGATMTAAGPFDLSTFNAGRASTVRIRFRFQSGANWAGPNQAAGWNVDDVDVDVDIFADCDIASKSQPGSVGNSLLVAPGSNLTWEPVPDAESYVVIRSTAPDLSGATEFATGEPTFTDPAVPPVGAAFFYEVLAATGCGARSAD